MSRKNVNLKLNAMLKNVVGLVTGGASGLGRATAARFIREGAKVTICDLPTSQGEEVAKELSSGKANQVSHIKVDLILTHALT